MIDFIKKIFISGYESGYEQGREDALREEMIRMDAAPKLTFVINDEIDNKIAQIKAECKANHG